MGLPREDRPPAWLRDYGELQADIDRMADFAAKLDAEVVNNYSAHLSYVYDDMTVKVPEPVDAFVELVEFMQTHQRSQEATAQLVTFFRDATGGFATAAREVSEHYRDTDVFSAARVDVVKAALSQTAVVQPGAEPTVS